MTVLGVVMIVVGYLLGSIPTGVLLVRLTTGRDVRDVGSGKTGGTNTIRAAGPAIGLLTAFLDGVKGGVAVALARAVVEEPLVEALAGLLAVVGHNYSIFIGFRGGAGTACTLGGALALWPWTGAILAAVGILTLAITRYASAGSIVVGITLPIIFALRAWLGDGPWPHLIHGLGTMALTLWALRANIQRLLSGSERRLSFRKKT